jgi:hypothetical protein
MPTKARKRGPCARLRFAAPYAANEDEASAATSRGAVYGVGCHTIDIGSTTVSDKSEPDRTP